MCGRPQIGRENVDGKVGENPVGNLIVFAVLRKRSRTMYYSICGSHNEMVTNV